MKAIVVKGPGQVEMVTDVPKPVCGDYEALVEVHYCGLCNGTDLQIIAGLLSEQEGMQPYPTVLGHEGSGIVVEVGKKVRYIKVGDKFIHPNLRRDSGKGYSKTYGGMAEFGLVPDKLALIEDGLGADWYSNEYTRFFKLPDSFDLCDGGVLQPLCECLSAARNFEVDDRKKVLIFGAGPMGIGVAKYCKILGCPDLTIVDMQGDRLQLAEKLAGVDRAVNIGEVDLKEALGDEQFDLAIDVVGKTQIILQASQYLKPYGVVGSMGVLKAGDEHLDMTRLKNNTSVHMLNFPYGEYDCIEENLEIIQKGLVNPKDYYSHVLSWDCLDEAIELIKSKKALKVVLKIKQ